MIFRLGSTNLPSLHYLPSPATPIPTLIRTRIPIHIPHTPLPLLIPSTYTNKTPSPSPPPRHLLTLMPPPMLTPTPTPTPTPSPTPTPTHMTNRQHTIPRVSMLPKLLLPSASQLPLDHLLYLLPLVLRLLHFLIHHHQHHHHYHHRLLLLLLITHLIIQFIRVPVSPARLLGL